MMFPLPESACDWCLADFDFVLPEECIASQPVVPRDEARLLRVARGGGLSDHRVFDLPDFLREGDVLVVNDTRVIPARLFGQRGAVKVEVLLNKEEAQEDPSVSLWVALARPAKRLKGGDEIIFAPDFSAEVMEKRDGGELVLRFAASRETLLGLLEKHGHVPLPPYIKRPQGDTPEDRVRYQTVYAKRAGAVAAPTAGLHFTPELLLRLEAMGVTRESVTLHVGAGTFLPVKVERVAQHVMHAEWGEIAPDVAARIAQAKKEGRRVVAVGTTALRLLESAADEEGGVRPWRGDTDIFIVPGYRFRVVDALFTNFHLPKSTLFMLVSAFSGLDVMRRAYAYAVEKGYRFYSYGDACFLE